MIHREEGEGEKKERREEKKKNKPVPHTQLPFSEFIAYLKTKPAYQGIDIDQEWSKMETWSETKGVKPTHRRFVNWLNRAEKPITSEFKAGRF